MQGRVCLGLKFAVLYEVGDVFLNSVGQEFRLGRRPQGAGFRGGQGLRDDVADTLHSDPQWFVGPTLAVIERKRCRAMVAVIMSTGVAVLQMGPDRIGEADQDDDE